MRAVFAGEQAAAGGDEEVGGQAEASTARIQRRRGLAATEDAGQAAADAEQDCRPGARVEQGARRGFDSEGAVEVSSGIGDDREREIAGVRQKVPRAGVEDHDFADARLLEFVVPPHDGVEVEVADRTAGEAAELQVCGSVPPREFDVPGLDGDELPWGDGGSRVDAGRARR